MKYYKITSGGHIYAAGIGRGEIEISKEEYLMIMEAVKSRPTAPLGYEYILKEDLEWELSEYEEAEPELTEAEALAIILGGAV